MTFQLSNVKSLMVYSFSVPIKEAYARLKMDFNLQLCLAKTQGFALQSIIGEACCSSRWIISPSVVVFPFSERRMPPFLPRRAVIRQLLERNWITLTRWFLEINNLFDNSSNEVCLLGSKWLRKISERIPKSVKWFNCIKTENWINMIKKKRKHKVMCFVE